MLTPGLQKCFCCCFADLSNLLCNSRCCFSLIWISLFLCLPPYLSPIAPCTFSVSPASFFFSPFILHTPCFPCLHFSPPTGQPSTHCLSSSPFFFIPCTRVDFLVLREGASEPPRAPALLLPTSDLLRAGPGSCLAALCPQWALAGALPAHTAGWPPTPGVSTGCVCACACS